ncbi:MAG: OmpA family protein [Gammaproteobacteria bacterium]
MNKHYIYLICALLASALAGCTPPHKDIPQLTSEINAVYAGHYGQAMYHEEEAEEHAEVAKNVLEHWQKDYYWNIDEEVKAIDAARLAAQHRLESEKALCRWLTEVHSPNHHLTEVAQHVAAYFRTGSAVPYRSDESAIDLMAKYLQTHPDATADVTAYTDTVDNAAYNQDLAERRAATVQSMLIARGAKPEQLRVRAMGEAQGPDNTPDQGNRVVKISTVHPAYKDCPNLM